MGNHPTLDCYKHHENALKCKFVKAAYRVDCQCAYWINRKQPKFDTIYDDILSTKHKTSQNKINQYLNSVNHVMKFHYDDLIAGYMHTLYNNVNCNLNNCIMLRRNYCDKFKEDSIFSYINKQTRCQDEHQMLFFQSVDSIHEFLQHNKNDKSYFIEKRNIINMYTCNAQYYKTLTSRYIGINNQTDPPPNISPKPVIGGYESDSMSTSNKNTKSCKSYMSNSKLTEYKYARSFSYDSNKKHKKSYVGCTHQNLQEELQEECKLSKRSWKGLIIKSKQLGATHEIKCIRHNKHIDKQLSTIRILILFIYTSYESFQKKLNDLARLSSNVTHQLNLKQAKKLHSTLGHSFKMLSETVQNYGLLSAGDENIKTVYRGVSILPLFSKYLLTCFAPCSTSISFNAATSFAGVDNGCVLELNVPSNSTYFNMQYISAFKLEFEMLFYGANSLLCIEQIYRHIGTCKIDLTGMVLLEKITSPENNHYKYEFHQNAKKSLIELLHNEYEEEKDDVSLQQEFEYFVAKKRMLVLKDARLMRFITGNKRNFDEKYLNICEIIKIFNETRYLTITKSYNVNIDYITQFACCNSVHTNFPNKLRQIEYYHKYNKDDLNKIRLKLASVWSEKDCLWEPFFAAHVITFKKDVVTSLNILKEND